MDEGWRRGGRKGAVARVEEGRRHGRGHGRGTRKRIDQWVLQVGRRGSFWGREGPIRGEEGSRADWVVGVNRYIILRADAGVIGGPTGDNTL